MDEALVTGAPEFAAVPGYHLQFYIVIPACVDPVKALLSFFANVHMRSYR